MFPILFESLRETFTMVLFSSLLTLFVGVPLGLIIANNARQKTLPQKGLFRFLFFSTSLVKAIPYLLVVALFVPVVNWLTRHQVSSVFAAILPLTLAGVPLLAHHIYQAIKKLPKELFDIAENFGASNRQTLFHILLPEAFPDIVRAITNTIVTLFGFSIIAGALGAGGIGQLAVERSLEHPNPYTIMLLIGIFIILIQIIERTGGYIAEKISKR